MTRSLVGSAGGSHPPRPGRPIPVADVPIEPVLSAGAFLPQHAATQPSVLDDQRTYTVTSGRYAIALALRHMGLAAGAAVLVPAYHCSAMIEPILAAGGRAVFYRLQPDLAVDLADVAQRIDKATRALMITHYFGFPQDGARLQAFARERGLVLIEDCAHSLFGSHGGRPLGGFGDYAIGSPRKFYPVPDGGCLVVRANSGNAVSVRLQAALAELRQMVGFVDLSVDYGRLRLLAPAFAAASRLRALMRRRGATPPVAAPEQDEGPAPFFDFEPAAASLRMNRLSELVVRAAARTRIVQRRRANYRLLCEALGRLPGCRPLFPTLPDGVVPYLFPLWVDRLDEVFPRLEDLAVPMQRFGQFLWPDVDETTCAVSVGLARHVVQFPVHQELRRDEIDSVVARVTATVMDAAGDAKRSPALDAGESAARHDSHPVGIA